ncbi:MAG: type II toxin-antitoxin system RelE/ParE family toxin [Bacteroidota bacterium]|jgi:mRNA-degrading endonuclease RelE of RelBE toxin-antitoxin system
MSYNVEVLPRFEKDLKRLVKKFPSLKKEFIELVNELKENPIKGISLGNNCYKIRLAIASKGKGKSGGARVISHIKVIENTVFLLTIFDKSEQESLSDNELLEILNTIK